MNVTPATKWFSSHKTGQLMDMNAETINRILGFEPNVDDDPDKVVNSWRFIADGKQCAIWDYKGSEKYGQFSTFGPDYVFEELFGTNY